MKRVWLLCKICFTISALMIIGASCSTDEPKATGSIEEPNDKIDKNDKIEYYVKYQSYVTIPSSYNIDIKVSVITEKGIQTFSVPRTWEGIFGPFNELTTLIISSNTAGFNPSMTSCRGCISICRGNQPFILKADKSFNGTSYYVSYTVEKEDLK